MENAGQYEAQAQNGSNTWKLLIVGFCLVYSLFIFWLIFYATYTAKVSFIAPIRAWYQHSITYFFPVEWIQAKRIVASDCEIEHANEPKRQGISLPRDKKFVLFPLKPDDVSDVNQKMPICWVIIIYNSKQNGSIVYRTNRGDQRSLYVTSLPSL